MQKRKCSSSCVVSPFVELCWSQYRILNRKCQPTNYTKRMGFALLRSSVLTTFAIHTSAPSALSVSRRSSMASFRMMSLTFISRIVLARSFSSSFNRDILDVLLHLRNFDVFERVDAPSRALDLGGEQLRGLLDLGKAEQVGQNVAELAHRVVELAARLGEAVRINIPAVLARELELIAPAPRRSSRSPCPFRAKRSAWGTIAPAQAFPATSARSPR